MGHEPSLKDDAAGRVREHGRFGGDDAGTERAGADVVHATVSASNSRSTMRLSFATSAPAQPAAVALPNVGADRVDADLYALAGEGVKGR